MPLQFKTTPAPIPQPPERLILAAVLMAACMSIAFMLLGFNLWPDFPVEFYLAAKAKAIFFANDAANAAIVERHFPVGIIVRVSVGLAVALAVAWTAWIFRAQRKPVIKRGGQLDSSEARRKLNRM